MAKRRLRKTKSGFPNTFCFRRHPVILLNRKILASTNSVSWFPCPRIRDITSDRLALVKMSGMHS
jgi:hypothetical protein